MKNQTLDRRSRYSIKVIQQALFTLLEKKSLDEITVVDICNTADVNRGTFYKYYRDVPDLYDKTEDDLVEKIHSLVPDTATAAPMDTSPLKNVLQVLTTCSEFTFITEHHMYSDRLAQKILANATPYIRGLTKTYCPDISEQDSILLTEYIMGGCSKIITYWLSSGMEIPAESLEKFMVKVISQSLGSDNGSVASHS